MKTKLIGLFLLIAINSNAYQQSHEKQYNWNKYLKSIQFRTDYRIMIEKIKKREGFSPVRYSDGKYIYIGYGQNVSLYHESIPETINQYEATIILKQSFWKHVLMVKKVFPKLKGKELIDNAYLSYIMGIGKLIKIRKYELR